MIAIVTGAGGGLGRATARKLAAAGARLAITDVDEGALAETAAALRTEGAEAVVLPGDITRPETIDRLVAEAVARFGTVTALCNVAGVLGLGGPVESYTTAEFDRVMHANCLAQLLAIQRVVPEMKRAGRGAIVNVASVGALVGLPMMAVYCASKSAVLGLTRAVALELAPTIRCNAVCPGGIDTPMARNFLEQFAEAERDAMVEKLVGRQMIRRFALPEEIAETIAFLASHRSSFLTGAVIQADAGHSSW